MAGNLADRFNGKMVDKYGGVQPHSLAFIFGVPATLISMHQCYCYPIASVVSSILQLPPTADGETARASFKKPGTYLYAVKL